MATPTQNSVPTSAYGTTIFFDEADSLFYGVKWGGGVGTGVTLTYSFPQGTTWWQTPYSGDEEPDALYGLDAGQMDAVRDALASWAAVAGLSFTEVEDTETTVGELRFTFTDNMPSTSAAHAYMPSNAPTSGDIWFSSDDLDTKATPGSYLYGTMIHEIGHALGLNHSFDMSPEFDNLFYTQMSYTASPWSEDADNFATFYPTTPMYYDILAIQAIYGTDGVSTNAGDTIYRFTGGYYFETIFDTGGKDTIVYSGSDTCEIYLAEGTFSELSREIEFSTANSRATVCIGPDTVIENARGGSRNDRIEGNEVKNKLSGGGGRDTIYGGAGNDIIIGGNGYDRLKGNSGSDRFDFNALAEIGKTSHDVILDFAPGFDDIDLSTIDANSRKADDQKFRFVETADKTLNGKAGELCWYKQGGNTFVMGDINGDKVADFILELSGSKSLTVGDFIL